MEKVFATAENLVSHIKEYVEVRVDEVKLDMADKSSRVMADLIARTIVFLISGFFILFVSLAIAYLLGENWGKLWLGFLVVGGFYFMLALIVWVGREKMIRIPIINSIWNQLSGKDDDTDD